MESVKNGLRGQDFSEYNAVINAVEKLWESTKTEFYRWIDNGGGCVEK